MLENNTHTVHFAGTYMQHYFDCASCKLEAVSGMSSLWCNEEDFALWLLIDVCETQPAAVYTKH